MNETKFPDAIDAKLVGTYPALTKSGGGYVWDEVLEYRVWCHPELGAPAEDGDDDYYYAYATYAEAASLQEFAWHGGAARPHPPG